MVAAIEPLVRAKLMMGLLALVVLGLGMLAMIIMAGRYARRVARTPLPPSRVHEDRWYSKPLHSQQANPQSSDVDERESGRQSGADGADPDGADSEGAGPDGPGG